MFIFIAVFDFREDLIFSIISPNALSVWWGCSSVVEHMLCMYKALGSIPSTSSFSTTHFVSYTCFYSPKFIYTFLPTYKKKIKMIAIITRGRNENQNKRKLDAYLAHDR